MAQFAKFAFGLGILGLSSCDVDLGARTAQDGGSFGSIVFREACQRVTYTADIAARAADPNHPIDVSGASERALCAGEVPPPDAADPSVRALFAEHDDIQKSIDAALPGDPILSSLDAYLRALTPLEDDGTVDQILSRTGGLLATWSADPALVAGLTRLNHSTGMRSPDTAGGAIRAVVKAPGLDDLIGKSVPLLLPGGAARDPFLALLAGGAFELRHITADADPQSPERTPQLLVNLLLSGSADLITGQPLLIARRDFRSLPVLTDVVAPYTLDPKLGLASADANGRFLDSMGNPLPYVPPLPEPGKKDVFNRDAMGRVLRGDGGTLFQYTDLDGTLLYALLQDGNRLFATSKAGTTRELDIPFGLLRGASLLLGSRDPAATKTKDNETLTYNGFSAQSSILLDMVYGGLTLLRFGTGTPGKDIGDLLQSTQNLMGNKTNESPLSRSLGALLAAADEAKKPDYDAAKIPVDSTLYDDLAPILARVFAVPGLAEDIVGALQDPHGKALGYMSAQLMNDRDYFFMKQPKTTADLDANGLLDPQQFGTVGQFGSAPDRGTPDSDVTIDWRNETTRDSQNNRSVLQRLLNVLADTNGGKPLCNGRYAALQTAEPFFAECDMFQVDNIARFFLLSIASPGLRSDPSTFAKQSASFIEAIKNGRVCRGTSGDPNANIKCDDLVGPFTGVLPDDPSSDGTLQFIMRIKGFGRYPEPTAAGRALFIDLGTATTNPPFHAGLKKLLFNHVPNGDGTLSVDPADPDDRKFVDGNGKLRLFIDDHNGVLFALETVRGPKTYPDGTANPFPDDNFYDAMRPLVDAFARHAECFARDNMGTCMSGQNATQILADAMTVLHRHWPSVGSRLFGRSFADSYGPAVHPDGAESYETLAAQVMAGDLLPSTADLSPILTSLTVDGTVGGPKALPIIVRALRFAFDPSMAPVGLAPRGVDPSTKALRNDGQPAYNDPTLTQVLGASQAGKWSLYYVLAGAFQKKRALFDAPANQAARDKWNQAVSDAIDAFLAVDSTDMMGTKTYHFDNQRIRPVSVLALTFLRQRVTAHAADLTGWRDTLQQDAQDSLTGPLAAALVDLGVQLEANDDARRATYTLLQQVLDPTQKDSLRAMAAAAADGAQVLLDDGDLVPVGKGLSIALDAKTGPVDPGLTLASKGRMLEQMSPDITVKPFLPALLSSFYSQDTTGAYPMFHLSDAIAEVNRATPGQPGSYVQKDYQVLLSNVAGFLLDQKRGLSRFITIVRERCGTDTGPDCPK